MHDTSLVNKILKRADAVIQLSNHEKISPSFCFRQKMLTALLAGIFGLKQNVKGRSYFFHHH